MREVQYQRHEHTRPEPETRRAPLPTFVYDVPYLGACGVFPPLHILNEILAGGGEVGGMGPGATWEPFEIGQDEYDELVRGLGALDPRTLGEAARYGDFTFTFDASFDDIRTRLEWLAAVCEKHRDAYHERIKSARPGSR